MSRHVHGQNRRILIPSHIRLRHQHLAWPQQHSCQEDSSQTQRPERPAAARHFGAQPRCLEGTQQNIAKGGHGSWRSCHRPNTTANTVISNSVQIWESFSFVWEFGCVPFWTQFGWLFGSETIHLGTDSFFGGHLIFQALSLNFVTHLAEMVIYLIEYP